MTTTYERLCYRMEDMARRVSELTGFDEKELMEWLRKDKYTICYLSNNPVRIENSRKILARHYAGLLNIVNRTENGFETKERQYVFINCNNPEEYEGMHADLVILDYKEPMITIAESILKGSYLPEGERMVDDKAINTSDDVDLSLW